MSKIHTFFNLLFHDRKELRIAFVGNFSRSKVSHLLSDKAYITFIYKATFCKKPNLKEPKTFNEKLQWLKLYNRDPEYCKLVDKYEVKEYIADTIGAQYIIPTLGIWENFDEIDFNLLPNQFVLKCTHDSGSVVICRDKATFDTKSAKEKIDRKMKMNLFWHGREWPYKNLKPRIIAEQYMEDPKTAELRDYKFFCFNGEVKCFKIDYDRFKDHRANYYAPNGELLKFGESVFPPDFERIVELPKSKEKMITLAQQLSAQHPFLRVDFYEIDGQIYFGELTFFPASGFGPFEPEEWDYKLGEWIHLPERR